VPTAHIKLKEIRKKSPSNLQQTDGSSISLNEPGKNTHTGIFMPKDSGVFPPIKGNIEEKYQNYYPADKSAHSPKKYAMRDELISKVV
jgi:hypothetical protein